METRNRAFVAIVNLRFYPETRFNVVCACARQASADMGDRGLLRAMLAKDERIVANTAVMCARAQTQKQARRLPPTQAAPSPCCRKRAGSGAFIVLLIDREPGAVFCVRVRRGRARLQYGRL